MISGTDGSPRENLIACSVTSADQANDGETSALWIVPLEDGGAPWQLTQGGTQNNTPRWSPDGQRLGFISDRAGTLQLFTIPRHGGEATQLTQDGPAVVSFEWSPDGHRLAVIRAVMVDPNLRGARPAPDASAPPPDSPRVVWKLPYKMDGVGYTLDREMRLFVVDAATGEATALAEGPFDVKVARWSPDGTQIVYVRTREGEESHRSDVWTMNADGSNARQLTYELAQVIYPVWSPDGRWIVFGGTVDEGDAHVSLWLIEVASGEVRQIGGVDLELGAEADSLQFAGNDSSCVLAVIASRGAQHLCEVSIPDGRISPLVEGDRHVSKLAHTPDFLAYTAETPVLPMEVHACRRDGTDERGVTQFNTWWNERTKATMQRRRFVVPNGDGGTETVDGWLIRPAGATGTGPLLVDVHGGPAAYTLFDYPTISYWPALWSQGWSILALNAVGSASFGKDFADRLNGRWGELDLPQFEAAVKALQDDGIADDRVVMAGKSYGGFMSAWAASHSTMFRAVVVMAPVANIESHCGTSDSGYYSDSYTMPDDRAESRALMRRLSPVQHAHHTVAPMLVLQGSDDERCPRNQAEELFVTVRRTTRTPCELVLYPAGTHKFTSIAKPSHRLDAATRLVEWADRWVDQPLQPLQER
jgi:dipeptidyl aminopeptidase/acylaminoacyl peptidase